MGSYCALCGVHVLPGVRQCTMCGNTRLSSAPAQDDSEPTFNFKQRALPHAPMPKWLWAVAIGLLLTPIFRANAILSSEIPALFDVRYQAYRDGHPGLVGLLYFEIAMNIVLILAAVGLNFLFYTRSRIFPKIMVAYISVTFLYLVAIAGIMNSLFPSAVGSAASFYSLVRWLIWAGLMIPYLLVSPEVKVRFDR